MKGAPITYSAQELDWIEARKTMPRRQLHAEFIRQFSRTDVSLVNLTALCKRKGWLTGRTGRFPKGNVSANKGKKMPYNAASAATWFKKGEKPHNTNFLGHERIGHDGYVWISIDETDPHTGFERRYVQKHRHLWMQKNGPIPDGHVLKCLDGNKTNCDPSNWECIPRGLLPHLSGRWRGIKYDNAPEELKPVIMTSAKLLHTAAELKKTERK